MLTTKNRMVGASLIFAVLAGACGAPGATGPATVASSGGNTNSDRPTPIDTTGNDGAVVHGQAVYQVNGYNESALEKALKSLLINSAYAAASGSSSVNYTNSASTSFNIDVTQLTPGQFTGSTLSLGSISLAGLSDNNLKVCGNNGHSKCTQAVIRIYTTGNIAGFANTADGYGAPVYAGNLNPSTAVGLGAEGSVQVHTLAIPANKHVVNLSDFSAPTYNVFSDFSNAGAGLYSMTIVVEYALLP